MPKFNKPYRISDGDLSIATCFETKDGAKKHLKMLKKLNRAKYGYFKVKKRVDYGYKA